MAGGLLTLFEGFALLPEARVGALLPRDRSKNLGEHLAANVSRVERLSGRCEERAAHVAQFEHAGEVAVLASEPVQLPDDHPVNLPGAERLEYPFELGPVRLQAVS